MARDIDYFEEKFGKPENAVMPTSSDIARYKGVLPDVLLEYWQHFGFAAFRKGRFQLVNPADYAEALQFWLAGSELVNKDKYHVIQVGVFGDLRTWGETTGDGFTIAPLHSHIHLNKKDYSKQISDGEAEYFFESFLINCYPTSFDTSDDRGPMYARARKRLGPLAHDEIYGFVPALQLGGEWDEKSLKKVSGPEHLHMLRGLAKPRILTFKELGQAAFGDGAYDLIKDDLD